MIYPNISNIQTSKDILSNFLGYDNRIGCVEGSFFDEENVTSDHYPVLSPRAKRMMALGDIPYIPDNISENRFIVGSKDYNADRIINTSDGAELISILCDSLTNGINSDGPTVGRKGIIEPGLVYGGQRIITRSNGLGVNLFPACVKGYWRTGSTSGTATFDTGSTTAETYCGNPELIEIPENLNRFMVISLVTEAGYNSTITLLQYGQDRKPVGEPRVVSDKTFNFVPQSVAKYLGFNITLTKDKETVKSPQYYVSDIQVEYGEKASGYQEYTGDLSFHMLADVEHQIIRMGTRLVIFPEKYWVGIDGNDKGKFGTLDDFIRCSMPVIKACDSKGDLMDWHPADYYGDEEGKHKPQTGDYMITTNANGQDSIKVYSDLTKSWATVQSTYISIRVKDTEAVGSRIKEGDGVTVMAFTTATGSSANTLYTIPNADQLFVTEEKDARYSRSLFESFLMGIDGGGENYKPKSFTAPVKKVIKKDGYVYYVVPGFIKAKEIAVPEQCPVVITRRVPDMSYIVECKNRLWGCSRDGHEIYCCKIGDPTNWNYFAGTAADSYAATVGSTGKFTGACNYNQNPIFFKENVFLKVSVSSSGAHSYREQDSEGIQYGSNKSLVNVEGALYYLSQNGVYAFDGSIPQKVSDALGNHRYESGIACKLNGKYYLSVIERDSSASGTVSRKDCLTGKAKHILLSFDTAKTMWTKEDGGKFLITDMYSKDSTLYFTRYQEENTKKWYETWMAGVPCFMKRGKNDTTDFFYGNKAYLMEYTAASEGTPEKPIEWFAESPAIGYYTGNNKYIGRINVRLSLDFGSIVDFWMKYDNDNQWHHIFNMSGKGTKSFTIPVTPRRCDSFKYKLSGRGDCKVISISKQLEEGSDV